MTDALWYLGRGTGVMSLVLFSLVVVLGVVARTGRTFVGLPRFGVTMLHRTVSLMALGLLLIHVTSLMFDHYAQLDLVDAVVPFLGAYQPFWLGMGTLASDLVLVLIVSSLLRHTIGHRTWRVLHWSAYLCWPVAVVHAIGNGTDGTSSWLLIIVAVCGAGVLTSVGWRYAVTRPAPDRSISAPAPAIARVPVEVGPSR